uniref:K Homology domain-containing protein n=1 Tax=Acrobeloides nanus TaxID=290746 RepID=A0A914EPC5_9BILA
MSCVEKEDLRAHCMGVLPAGGFVFKVSLDLARRLLAQNSIITLLGNSAKFESTIGMNGRVWISAFDTVQTLAIRDIILESEKIYESELPMFVNQKIRSMRGVFPSLNAANKMEVDNSQ